MSGIALQDGSGAGAAGAVRPRLGTGDAFRATSILDRAARRLVFALLRRLRRGRMRLTDADGVYHLGPDDAPLSVSILVRDPSLYRRMLTGGHLAAGEAYMEGAWDCDDLVTVCRLFILEDQILNGAAPGLLRFARPALWLLHALRRNTRSGSRRNSPAHDDLGNDFYRLFLDAEMMYSSASFEHPESSLEEAARAKNERICRKLGLRPGLRLLEIGTGWGGFAVHAAREHGCHVTTTTISRHQYEGALRRVGEAGLEDLVDVRLEDYRDLQGRYDRVVSIEMIEAVGHQYIGTFFERCAELLEADGRLLVQGITVPEWAWERHKRSMDFMKRYIFPGCSLISVQAVASAMAGTDLRWENLEDIGPHYARTMREWRRRYHARLGEVREQGFDDRFLRMWDFYLASCEAAFEERYTSDVQILLARGADRGESLLPEIPHPAAAAGTDASHGSSAQPAAVDAAAPRAARSPEMAA
jgi:cyclopropane-fatty-acyl-phospholipid synthase